jgi:hypothetical protein
MYKKCFTLVSVIILLALAASGCSSAASSEAAAPPPSEITIADPVGQTPEQVTETFYSWYIQSTQGIPPRRAPYAQTGYLTDDLLNQIERTTASFDKGGYDPILCAQDIPESVSVSPIAAEGDSASVLVNTSFPGHSFQVALTLVDGVWCLSDIVCAPPAAHPQPTPITPEPDAVVEAFYTWYLGYIGDQANPRNPLVDGAYRSSEHLTPGLVQKADGIIASFDQGGFDPFLCAQDIPDRFDLDPAVVSGDIARLVVRTNFEGHAFTVALQQVDGVWKMSDILCEVEQTGETTPVNAPVMADDPTGDWQTYVNAQYGFQIKYPVGWAYQEVTNGPDHPPIGSPNLKMIVLFMPQAWADEMSKGGRPDPNGPEITPLSLEVTLGTLEEYQQAYMPAARSENVVINGKTLVREEEVLTDELSMIRYVFESQANPDLRVTVLDPISGFPQRLAGQEELADAFQVIVSSFEFNS